MDDKNLFNRRNGSGIRGRIAQEQRSSIDLNEPMLTEEYRDYQYSEPVDQKILTDQSDKLPSTQEGGFFGSQESQPETDTVSTPKGAADTKQAAVVAPKPVPIAKIDDKSAISDMAFSFLDGVMDTRINSKLGDLQRNNMDLQNKLDYITNTVNKAKEIKQYNDMLDTVEDNPEEFNRVSNMLNAARQEYMQMKPNTDKYLQELHEKRKDINGISDVSKLKGSENVINFINTLSEANMAEIEKKTEDINESQGTKRYINSIYQISDEYKQKAATTKFAWTDPSTWQYTVPSTLGSSFSLMEATAVGMGASLTGSFLLKQLPKLAMTGGMSMAATMAVSLGASAANVWANVAARRDESNAEVYDAYKQKMYQEAEQGGIDINDVIAKGEQQLRTTAGVDTSDLNESQMLDYMLMHNIKIDTPGFEDLKISARKDIDNLFQQNMALAISDVGQSLLMIPGAGRMMKRALTANGKLTLGDDLAKFAGKAADDLAGGIATKMAGIGVTKTGVQQLMRKGLAPIAKIGLSSVGEMNEEGTQYIQTRNFLADKYANTESNLFTSLAQNFDATIDAFGGIMGLSSDQALNNDVELANSMKLGALVSVIMGGGAQTVMPSREGNAIAQYVDDVKGSNIAKGIMSSHIAAKEDSEIIKQYAVAGNMTASKQAGLLTELENSKESLPPGITTEDIDNEIKRAKRVFSLIKSPVMNDLAKAIDVKKGSDDYNTLLSMAVRSEEAAREARANATKAQNVYSNLWEAPEVNDFFDLHNVPAERRELYKQYIKLQTEKRGTDQLSDEIADTSNTFASLSGKYDFQFDPNRTDDYIFELSKLSKDLDGAISSISDQMNEQFGTRPALDRIDDLEYPVQTAIPSYLMNSMRANEAISLSNAFNNIEHTPFGRSKRTKNGSIVAKALKDYNAAEALNVQINNQAINDEAVPPAAPAVGPVADSDKHIDETIKEVAENPAKFSILPEIEEAKPVEEKPSSEPSIKWLYEPTLTDPFEDGSSPASVEPAPVVEEATPSAPVVEDAKSKTTVVPSDTRTPVKVDSSADIFARTPNGPQGVDDISFNESFMFGDEAYDDPVDLPAGLFADDYTSSGGSQGATPTASTAKVDKVDIVASKAKKETVPIEEKTPLTVEPVKAPTGVEAPPTNPFEAASEGFISEDGETAYPVQPAKPVRGRPKKAEPSKEPVPEVVKEDLKQEEAPTPREKLLAERKAKAEQVTAKKEKVAKNALKGHPEVSEEHANTTDGNPFANASEEAPAGFNDEENETKDVEDMDFDYGSTYDPIQEDNPTIEYEKPAKAKRTAKKGPATEAERIEANKAEQEEEDGEYTSEYNPFASAPEGFVDEEGVMHAPEPKIPTSRRVDPLLNEDLAEIAEFFNVTMDEPTDVSTVVGTKFLPDGSLPVEKIPNLGFTSNTVYFSDKAMFEGDGNGAEFDQYLSTPGNLGKSTVTISVGKPGDKYSGKFDPNNKATWDDAAIYVHVTSPEGKRFSGALKTPNGATALYASKNRDLDAKDLAHLSEVRGEIIEAYAKNPDAVIKPKLAIQSNGLFNVARGKDNRAVNRPVMEVKGLGLPENVRDLDASGVKFGVGRGAKNVFMIVDETGHTIPGKGDSGKIYLYPNKTNTPSGRWAPPIKLNELRLSDAPDLADLLYDTFVTQRNRFDTFEMEVDGKLTSFRFGAKDVAIFIANNGEHTMVSDSDREKFAYLIPKQLWYDFEKEVYHVGPNIWSRRYLLTPQGRQDFVNYALENFHINTDESMLHEMLNYKFYNAMYRTKSLKELRFSKNFAIALEDLDIAPDYSNKKREGDRELITNLQWMVKNGWLKSDLQDQIFKSPFMYISGVEAEAAPAQKAEAVKVISDENNPIKGEDNPSLDDDYVMDFFGLDLALPKQVVSEKATIANTEQSKKWLMDTLGLTEDQVVVANGFIRTIANGSVVMGTTYRDSIVLSESTVPGTGYHEAFHRVSTLLISKAQQEKMYAEYRRVNPEYAKASNLEVEEALAESFREFLLKREKPIYSILKWFNPIVTFISKMFKPNSFTTMYRRIANGDFSKYKMRPERYAEFENAYKDGLNLTIGEGDAAYDSKAFPDYYSFYNNAIPALVATLLAVNKATTISDVNKISTAKLRSHLGKLRDRSKNSSQIAALNEILEHFDDVFMPEVVKSMDYLSIRAVDRDRAQEMADKDATNVGTIQNYDKASYEVSKKANALASAKMFIATIPMVNFKYDDVDGVSVKSAVPSVDPITGMLRFVDFDSSWNLILNNMYNVETWDDLITVSAEKSKTSPFFYQLNKRLTRLDDINLQTQLLQTIKGNKHNMFAVKYGTKPSADGRGVQVYWTVDDSAVDKASMAYPELWSQVFYNSNLVDISEDGSSVNAEKVIAIRERFNQVVADEMATVPTNASVDKAIAGLVGVLNEIGIAVDKETIETALTSSRVAPVGSTRASALHAMLTDARNGSLQYLFSHNLPALMAGNAEHTTAIGKNVRTLTNAFVGLGKNSIVNTLARSYAQVHPNPEEVMVLGADGNLLYPISQNCYMSDQVRWLNLGGQDLTDLNNVTYSRGSMILQALNRNHKIKLNTYVNFKSDQSGDMGRDYMGISPAEDYLSKMALTANDHIILPTMADKKMYFTLTGVRLFNEPIELVRQNDGSITINNSTRVVDHFQSIGLDEINAIAEYYNNRAKVAADPDLAVKNYHTGKQNGGRFRHFTHIPKTINGVTSMISLNDMLDDAESNGTIIETIEKLRKGLFGPESNTDYVYDTINDMLKYVTAAELDTVERLGIITKANGWYKNNTNVSDSRKNPGVGGLDHERMATVMTEYTSAGFSKEVAEHAAIMSIVSNYATNSIASVIEVEKIFTGDPAFYGSAEDKIKRLSEVLSTGDNLRTSWPDGHRLANRQQFTASELKDNEIVSHQFQELKDMFTQSYARKYIGELYSIPESQLHAAVNDPGSRTKYPDAWREADKTASVSVSAYGYNKRKKTGNINQTDASVYISPDMYRDIMEMLGEWSPEIERAYDIMESDEDWTNNPTLYHESLEALIKPLKMMYYGQHLIPELNIQVPIFDKMAMFPMFKVMAKGDNRAIYERMTSQGEYAGLNKIDMLAFSSAVKVGSRSPGVFYSDLENNSISDLSTWSTFPQEFKYLRRQLVTDPHAAERQMLGTQAAKAALSNIVLDRIYGEGKDGEKITGYKLRDTVFGCMNELSELGIDRILDEIGKPDGTIDIPKLSAYLIKAAKSKGMGPEIIDGLSIVNGDFKVPLSALSDSKWLESSMVGFTNREAIDINLPGGAFVQMSSFGYKSITTTSDAYNDGQKLSLNNPDGSMDAMVSINLLKSIIPGYSKKSYQRARQWLLDNNIIGNHDGVGPVGMGYRIPTQGLSSISALRIVDIFPENIGDTVMLPDAFTTLTGSDFDIDKLYIAVYNYKTVDSTDGTVGKNGLLRNVKRAERYQMAPDADPKEASREELENRLLDMYLMVLTDKSNMDETKLPLDNTTDIVKNVVLPIVSGDNKSKAGYAFMHVTPTYQLNKKYEYSGGKDGIAPFALNNVHHVLTQLMNLTFSRHDLLAGLGLTTVNGINSRQVMDYERDKYGNKLKDEDGSYIPILDRGERILDWLSAMINANVDVAKDPYVMRLNVVQWTYNMTDFLLRTGMGRDTFFFTAQPILKEIASAVQNASGKYGVDPTKTASQLEREAIGNVVKKYVAHAYEANIAESKSEEEMSSTAEVIRAIETEEFIADDVISYDVFNRDTLINNLIARNDGVRNREYYMNQLKVWATYAALTPYAQELSELVHLSQIDTKKFGTNFNLQRRFMYRLKDFMLNNKVFATADIAKFFEDSFLNTKIKNSLEFNSRLFNGTMISSTEQFNRTVDNILLWTGQAKTKDDRTLKIAANETEAAFKAPFFEDYADKMGLNTHDLFYGSTSMATRLSRLKTDILAGDYGNMLAPDGTIKNELLNYLSSEFKQVGDIYDSPNIITVPRIKSNDKFLETRLTKYWEELLYSEVREVKEFAEDLVVYAFVASGDNYNKNSFFNLVPNSHKEKLGYSGFVRKLIGEMNAGTAAGTADMVFANTWYNNSLVRETRVGRDDRQLFATEKIADKVYPVLLTKAVSDTVQSSQPLGKNAAGQPIFRPYIKLNLDSSNNPETTVLYKYIGWYPDSDADGVTPVYAAVNKKGLYMHGRVVREYNDNFDSALPFNNLPFKFGDEGLFDTHKVISKSGKETTRYVNVNAVSQVNASKWREIMRDIDMIEDYVIKDPVNDLSYDDVLRIAKESKDTKTVEVKKESARQSTEKLIEAKVNPSSMSVFTFDDGSEIVTPFQLNDQQKTALRGLEAFIANPEYTNNEVTLTGYAGTGKTTIIGLFDEYLFKKYSGTVFYSAVTYRANAVTKMNNPEAKTYTLNQLFGISAETDLTDSTLDLGKIVNEQRLVPKVSGGELIIIDEASMVSPAFYQFINNAKDVFEIKVIYVGDPAQLSYITNDGEKSAPSPVFSGNKGKVLSLTKVERTGDSPVLAEATSLRNGAWLSYETKLTEDGNGVEYTNDDAVANAAIEDAFTSEEFKDNKLFFRVLSATNDIIPSINAKVREIRFGKNPEQVVAGDILMGYDNLYNEAGTGGEPVIINSGDYEVLSVTPDTTTIKLTTRGDLNATRLVPVKTFRVTLGNVMDDSRGPVTVTIVDNNTPRSVFLDVANELQALNAARSQAFRKRDYGLARSIGNRLVDIKTSFVSMKNIEVGGKLKIKKMLDYGYAHTIHKSQGGTYDNVLIYADSIDKFKNEDTQQQLAYVAVSRAKDKVTVLTKYKLAESAQAAPYVNSAKPVDKFSQLKEEENSTNYTVPTLKIISGGQTGVDTIGVQVAKELGIETGGTAPKGFLRERGMDNEDISSYNLVEITDEEQADYTRRKGKRDPYTGRTELNVRNSDGTVYFYTSDDKTGLLATKRSADDWNKPFITNPTAEELNKWLNNNNIKTLNVAGNRGSKLAGEQASNIGNIIKNAFSTPVQQEVSNTSNPFDDAPSFSDEVVVDGDSIQTLVTVNDNWLKETTISTRRAELEEIIKQRTDIDANAFRSEFDATVEAFKDADSDSLNNALIKLLCKY